ncbi:MAG: hypothetical protein AAGF87_14755 [Bacteroidota bacterium]
MLVYISRIKLFAPLCCLLLLGNIQTLWGQDVEGFWSGINERIQSGEYLKVSGNVQAGLRYNSINGIGARQAPFQANLNAGLLIDILGIKGPFAAAFSSQNTTYQLPAYAFYGFSPSYKWIKLHFGDRSLSFSPYSLNGLNFRGFGMELTPGKFYFGIMRGRLRRERLIDAGAIQNLDPIYRRMGSGVKVGFDNGTDQIALSLFHARDDASSLDLPDSASVRPQENLVLEVQGKKQISDFISLDFNFAHSALSRDTEAPILEDINGGLNGSILGLFKARSSSSYNQAYGIGIKLAPKFGQLSLDYERIGTGFQSLGSLAFLNDTEQFSAGVNTSLAENKISLGANLGIQRNGLSDQAITGGNRLIGSINVGVSFSDRISSSLSVSNFNYTLRQRVSTVPFVVVDSIVIVQSNFSTQAATTIILSEEGQSALTLSGAYQNASSVNGDEIENTAVNSFYTAMAAYSFSQEDSGFNLTVSTLANFTEFNGLNTRILSPSVSAQKSLFGESVKADLGISYSSVSANGDLASTVIESRFGTNWDINDQQSLRFQIVLVNNQSKSSNAQFSNFRDLNGNLFYRFSF